MYIGQSSKKAQEQFSVVRTNLFIYSFFSKQEHESSEAMPRQVASRYAFRKIANLFSNSRVIRSLFVAVTLSCRDRFVAPAASKGHRAKWTSRDEIITLMHFRYHFNTGSALTLIR